jgi:hypothetical protein
METLVDPSERDFGTFVVEGFLVSGNERTIRLVMPPYALELARGDVLAAEELEPLPYQRTDVGIAVRLTLVSGCRLVAMFSAATYEKRLWPSRRPFAYVTRQGETPMKDDGTYAELERAFLTQRGIRVPQ